MVSRKLNHWYIEKFSAKFISHMGQCAMVSGQLDCYIAIQGSAYPPPNYIICY
jgi:hypothetical protein